MGKIHYKIRLSDLEHKKLNDVVKNEIISDKQKMRAKILLLSNFNVNYPKLADQNIADALNLSRQTIYNVHKKYIWYGLDGALKRKNRTDPPIKPKITDEIENSLLAMILEMPPSGKSTWSYRLLAEEAMKRNIIDSISHEAVRNILSKHKIDWPLKPTLSKIAKEISIDNNAVLIEKNDEPFPEQDDTDSENISQSQIILDKIREVILSDEFKNTSRSSKSDFIRRRKVDFADVILIILNTLRKTTQLEIDCFLEQYLLTKPSGYTKQSFSEARQKILPEAFIELNRILNDLFYADGEYKKFRNYRVLGIDGSKMQLPNNKQTRMRFGSIRNNLENLEIAQGLASTLFDLENKIIVSAELDRSDASERKLAMKHIDTMMHMQTAYDLDNLLIMDRGYPSFEVIKYIENAKIKYLARTKINFFKEVAQTKSNDEWVTITITPSRKKHLKQQNYFVNTGDSIVLRVLKFILPNGEQETLVTNLTDEEASADDCKALYFKRWGIETRYDELKNKFEVENFSAKTPIAIEQDFHAAIFLSNLATLIERDATELYQQKTVQKKTPLPNK